MHAVRVRVVNRIAIPNACALSTFSAIFRTLCHTNNIGGVNDLHSVHLIHGKRAVRRLSICRFVVRNGVGSSIHLRRNSIVVIDPCRSLIRVMNGIGHPVCCRVGPTRAITSLLGCTNNFVKSTCGGTMHVVHGDKHRRRMCGISRVSCSMFHLSSNSLVAISTMLSHFRGGIRIDNTICHPKLCRLSNRIGAIGRLVGGTRKLQKSTFLTQILLSHRHRSLARRVITISLRNVVGNAISSVPLRGGSRLCIPNVRSLGRDRAISVCNRILGPNAFLCSSGLAVRSVVIRTKNLARTTTAAYIDIAHHVGSPGDATCDDGLTRAFAFSVGSNLLANTNDFCLRPFSMIRIHHDPTCRIRHVIAITNRILFDNDCSLLGGGRHLDSIVNHTNKVAPTTCVGKKHLVHGHGSRRHQHRASILHVTRNNRNSSDVTIGGLTVSRACTMNVSVRGTLFGPKDSCSVILHRKSVICVPRCIGAIGVDNSIVCPGAMA